MAKRHNATGRSKGEARHIRLYHWLLASPAWLSLKPAARAVYVDLAARYNGSNNGQIHYSVREGPANLHIGKDCVARALKTLQDRGFIVPVKRGAFSLKLRHATEWRLTEFPCDVTHALPSKDFMRWPEIQNTVPVMRPTVPVARPNGPCNATVTPKKRSDGPCNATVKAKKSISRSLYSDTYSLPGGDAERAPSVEGLEGLNGASSVSARAPEGSAVARDHGPDALSPRSKYLQDYCKRGGRYG